MQNHRHRKLSQIIISNPPINPIKTEFLSFVKQKTKNNSNDVLFRFRRASIYIFVYETIGVLEILYCWAP